MAKYPNYLLILMFLLALLLRLFLLTSAHHGDLNNNISWGQIAATNGLNGFYGSDNSDDWPYSAPNQPPLTIIMFAAISIIWQIIKNFIWYLNWELLIFPSSLVWFWDEKGMDIMVKLPSVIADLGVGWIIYRYIVHRAKKSSKTALLITALWLINPVIWYNSSVWGQTDSLVNLLGLIAVFALLTKKLEKFALFFTLSLLFKGSLAIFVPVLITVTFLQNYSFKKWITATIVSVLTVIFVAFWFHPYPDFPVWLVDLYQKRILPGEIGYLTANAFNFWWLVDSGNTYDSTLFWSLPARIWSILIVVIGVFLTMYWLTRRKVSDYRVFAALTITSLITFLFLTRIHERYLYPFFPYATLLTAFNPIFFIFYLIVSTIHLINLYNFFWVPELLLLRNLLNNPMFTNFMAVSNLAIFFSILRHLSKPKL